MLNPQEQEIASCAESPKADPGLWNPGLHPDPEWVSASGGVKLPPSVSEAWPLSPAPESAHPGFV